MSIIGASNVITESVKDDAKKLAAKLDEIINIFNSKGDVAALAAIESAFTEFQSMELSLRYVKALCLRATKSINDAQVVKEIERIKVLTKNPDSILIYTLYEVPEDELRMQVIGNLMKVTRDQLNKVASGLISTEQLRGSGRKPIERLPFGHLLSFGESTLPPTPGSELKSDNPQKKKGASVPNSAHSSDAGFSTGDEKRESGKANNPGTQKQREEDARQKRRFGKGSSAAQVDTLTSSVSRKLHLDNSSGDPKASTAQYERKNDGAVTELALHNARNQRLSGIRQINLSISRPVNILVCVDIDKVLAEDSSATDGFGKVKGKNKLLIEGFALCRRHPKIHFASTSSTFNRMLGVEFLSDIGVPKEKQIVLAFYVLDLLKHLNEDWVQNAIKEFRKFDGKDWGLDCITDLTKVFADQPEFLGNLIDLAFYFTKVGDVVAEKYQKDPHYISATKRHNVDNPDDIITHVAVFDDSDKVFEALGKPLLDLFDRLKIPESERFKVLGFKYELLPSEDLMKKITLTTLSTFDDQVLELTGIRIPGLQDWINNQMGSELLGHGAFVKTTQALRELRP